MGGPPEGLLASSYRALIDFIVNGRIFCHLHPRPWRKRREKSMVVIMKPGTKKEDIDILVRKFRDQGLDVGITNGVG